MEKRRKGIIVSLLVLLLCASTGWGQNADIDLLRSINTHRNKDLDGVMAGITNSVYPVSAVAPLAELATGYRSHNKLLINSGWTTIAGLGGNFVIAFGLKYSIDRTRPYKVYPELQNYRDNKDASFPSGHTSFAFNTATSLVQTFPKWYVAVPAYAWATAVGYSRMHLGMHYPTDVLAGAVVGIGTSWLSVKGNQWIKHHRKNRKIAQPG